MQNSTRKIEELQDVQLRDKTLCPSILAKLDNPTTINCCYAPSNELLMQQYSNCLPGMNLGIETILRELCVSDDVCRII